MAALYDVVVLGPLGGKKLLGHRRRLRPARGNYVKNHGGTVIFSRGRAFGENTSE